MTGMPRWFLIFYNKSEKPIPVSGKAAASLPSITQVIRDDTLDI
tara:strand:- start:648 stop:779 length:132 start_codon:yes stop_codon:yes gene_type:complete